MATTSILRVSKGDIIIERSGKKNRMIPVRKVDFVSCSSFGVHVNDNACYEYSAVVNLVDGDATLGDLRDEVEEEVKEDALSDAFVLKTFDSEPYEAIADQIVKV